MYRIKSGHLVRILGASTSLGALMATDVERYITKRLEEGAARTTVSKELTTLRGALRLARRHRLFDRDPSELIPHFEAEYKPRSRFLTRPELNALLAELEPDRAARVAFIVATGARWGESDRAQRDDVLADRVALRGTKTKLAARIVPVLAEVGANTLLEVALAKGEGASPRLFRAWGNVRRDLAAACARAKIPAVTPNDLRRTLATWLRLRGVAPSLIGSMLGHTDGRMVERVYGRLPADELRRAISASAQRETGVRKSGRKAAK